MNDAKGRTIEGKISKLSAKCYPQFMRKQVLINSPGWIRFLIVLAKPFLSKKMIEKVAVSTSTSLLDDAWCTKWINPKWMPAFLGGQFSDTDLPLELSGKLLANPDKDEFAKVTVPARSMNTYRVPVPGKSRVRWQVTVPAYGILYSAVLEDAPLVETEYTAALPDGYAPKATLILRKPEKVRADTGMVQGIFELPYGGNLALTFDNSYSIIRGKQVVFAIEVLSK